MTSATPGISSRLVCCTIPLLPVMPIAVRCAPGIGWARNPKDSIFSHTARTSCSVACAFITTSIRPLFTLGPISLNGRHTGRNLPWRLQKTVAHRCSWLRRALECRSGGLLMLRRILTAMLCFCALAVAQQPLRPVHTFSIVAYDPATGEMGVAVQSHWFAVGGEVPWAEAGVGAVATQSFVDPSYGPLGLNLMRAGKSAPDALNGLLQSDDACRVRGVAMVDTQGRVATFTGAKDIQPAGGIAGSASGSP